MLLHVVAAGRMPYVHASLVQMYNKQLVLPACAGEMGDPGAGMDNSLSRRPCSTEPPYS